MINLIVSDAISIVKGCKIVKIRQKKMNLLVVSVLDGILQKNTVILSLINKITTDYFR